MKRWEMIAMLFVGIASGCVSVKQIGALNMISTRNVDPTLKYRAMATYSGGSRAELVRSKARTLDDAVNITVKRVPGGEFLMNAKIYAVDDSKYYAVEGDVWGSGDQVHRGFRAGDKVTFKNPAIFTTRKYLSGTIASLKSEEICLIAPDGEPANLIEVSYDNVTKTQAQAPQPQVWEATRAEQPSAPTREKESLAQSDIVNVVVANRAALDNCIETHLKNAGASGKMLMKWTIRTDGTTSNVSVASQSFSGALIGACLGRAIGSMRFPSHMRQGEPVTFPFEF